jgi:hypothetical protein
MDSATGIMYQQSYHEEREKNAALRADLAAANAAKEELSEAIKRIYTTQMYEDRKKESGVSVKMVSAILNAAALAGCRGGNK